MVSKIDLRICTLAVMLVLTVNSISFAQTRINFPKGRYSTNISGKLRAEEEKIFLVRGKKGQKLIVSVRSNNKEVTASYEDAYEIKDSFELTFMRTGDLKIFLYNGGKVTSYTLNVTIR